MYTTIKFTYVRNALPRDAVTIDFHPVIRKKLQPLIYLQNVYEKIIKKN